MLTAIQISRQRMITPNTFQPLPRTSSRLRPNDSITPFLSSTITGTMTLQITSRNRPGTMSSARPIAIAIPARIPATINVPSLGRTRWNVSPIVRSRRPSRTSATASTRAPCNQKTPTMPTRAPRRTPNQPKISASSNETSPRTM
jgi:hypothetical protein